MSTHYCVPCNRNLSPNDMRHWETKEHITNSFKYFHAPSKVTHQDEKMECFLCSNENISKNTTSCSRCKKSWCVVCDKKLSKCPFCRSHIYKRQNNSMMRDYVKEFEELQQRLSEM